MLKTSHRLSFFGGSAKRADHFTRTVKAHAPAETKSRLVTLCITHFIERHSAVIAFWLLACAVTESLFRHAVSYTTACDNVMEHAYLCLLCFEHLIQLLKIQIFNHWFCSWSFVPSILLPHTQFVCCRMPRNSAAQRQWERRQRLGNRASMMFKHILQNMLNWHLTTLLRISRASMILTLL